jgi:ZIP family zinc transporter
MQEPPRNGIWLSFLAGAATGLGGILIVALMDLTGAQDQHALLSLSLASAAGVMVTVSVVDLWLPLVRQDGLFHPTVAMGMGGVLFGVIARALASTSLGRAAEPLHLLPLVGASHSDRQQRAQQRNLRLALLTFVALTLHNFPEGLAVSVSSTKSESLGMTVAIAVAIHNGPEGMAIAAPLYAATNSRMKAIGAAFASGMSEPLGALVATLALGPMFKRWPWLVSYLLCLVAGIMLGVSFLELLPEAKSHAQKNQKLVAVGFLSGALVIGTTLSVV